KLRLSSTDLTRNSGAPLSLSTGVPSSPTRPSQCITQKIPRRSHVPVQKDSYTHQDGVWTRARRRAGRPVGPSRPREVSRPLLRELLLFRRRLWRLLLLGPARSERLVQLLALRGSRRRTRR